MVANVDTGGWLVGTRVERVPTKRICALAVAKPIGVIWHWTGTRGKGDRHAINVARMIAEHASHRSVGASWHLLIARSGLVVQSVPFTLGAIHCRGYRGHEVNRAYIGIELENAGYVIQGNSGWRGVANPHKPVVAWMPGPWPVPDEEVVPSAAGATLHAYTEAQIDAAEAVLRAIVAWAGVSREECALGHCDLDPERKVDPGLLWCGEHLPGILARVFRGNHS